MHMQEIDVFIDAAGEVRIEVRGAAGLDCLDLTRPLEEALGGPPLDRQLTAEAAAPPEATPARTRAATGG